MGWPSMRQGEVSSIYTTVRPCMEGKGPHVRPSLCPAEGGFQIWGLQPGQVECS